MPAKPAKPAKPAIPADSPTAAHGFRPYAPSQFVVRVGPDWSPIRAAAIWPIADALAAESGLAPPASASSAADAMLVLDLIDSGMLAPPPARRRRERAVSSRAVFYQAADA